MKKQPTDPEDAAYTRLRIAGYNTESTGPTNPRMRASRGAYTSAWYPTALACAAAVLARPAEDSDA